MGTFKNLLRAGIVAGVCGLGLCAAARKLKLGPRLADLAQSIEGVPFPGTQLYVFLASRQLRPMYAAIAEQILQEGDFHMILDIGTGPGYLPLEIASMNPASRVSGIDESPDMIQIALANARASKVGESVEFSTGDPKNLPFPGRYFDLAVTVNALHHWRDPVAVFDEVFHVLAPGGQFRVYDYRSDVPAEVWDTLSADLPFMFRAAMQFGPIASSRVAYSEDRLFELARKTHFADPELLQTTLPVFGRPMPVFNLLKMHKPGRHEG